MKKTTKKASWLLASLLVMFGLTSCGSSHKSTGVTPVQIIPTERWVGKADGSVRKEIRFLKEYYYPGIGQLTETDAKTPTLVKDSNGRFYDLIYDQDLKRWYPKAQLQAVHGWRDGGEISPPTKKVSPRPTTKRVTTRSRQGAVTKVPTPRPVAVPTASTPGASVSSGKKVVVTTLRPSRESLSEGDWGPRYMTKAEVEVERKRNRENNYHYVTD